MSRRGRNGNQMCGILLVDKPAGLTSHDVVDRIRKAAGMRRIGHTGTLDPAATGLLILCLGRATRLSEFLTGLDKTYEGTMRFGVTTDSYDSDGTIVDEREVPPLEPERIQAAFDQWTGEIMQVPPMLSAVKVGGERLYKRARKGETVERESRPVTVHEFTLLRYEPPLAHFRVRCTRGTYVRSLCHEVGEHLGCGGMLDSLRRNKVGFHSVDDAAPVEAFSSPADVERRLLALDKALDYPEVRIRPASRHTLAAGGVLFERDLERNWAAHEGWIQIKAASGELLAIGKLVMGPAGFQVQPRRVFCQQR